jgi:hypothetical protein
MGYVKAEVDFLVISNRGDSTQCPVQHLVNPPSILLVPFAPCYNRIFCTAQNLANLTAVQSGNYSSLGKAVGSTIRNLAFDTNDAIMKESQENGWPSE